LRQIAERQARTRKPPSRGLPNHKENGKKAGCRPPKNIPVEVPVSTFAGRTGKQGSSTRETVKKRPAARFVEVKICLSAEEYARGLPYFREKKHLPKFFVDAYTEIINRAEANNKAARRRKLMSDIDLLKPVLKEMFAQGELDFLFETRLVREGNGE